jgi:hypothetical protein
MTTDNNSHKRKTDAYFCWLYRIIIIIIMAVNTDATIVRRPKVSVALRVGFFAVLMNMRKRMRTG